ncbi:MAG: hypothetical protein EBS70_03940 [Actinobacteria bacterium]|nr:hypothetical protein [Actinomycetota bacterium]NBY12888.1 hypothetical protein [Actinomycetota bacterium]
MSDDSAVVMDFDGEEVSSHPQPGEVAAVRDEDSGSAQEVEIAKRGIAAIGRGRSQPGDPM